MLTSDTIYSTIIMKTGNIMGVNEKLLIKMRRKPIPSDITMNEVTRLLESRGFSLHSRNSSHLNFKHPKLSYILRFASHDDRKELKAIYIKLALEAIDDVEE